MKLTEEEKNLVLEHRAKRKAFEEKKKKQAECDHHWEYFCHGHNDDAYVCTRCGDTKWE